MPVPSNVDTGDVLRISGLSAGSLNAYLVPPTDVSGYKWISLYIENNSYNGVLSFQGSFDQATWDAISLYPLTNLQGANSSSGTSAFDLMVGGPVRFPFFAVQMTGYTSGTATGVLELRKDGLAGFALTTTLTGMLDGTASFGITNNDGTANQAIAAGHAADTVIYGQKSFLSHVLVTATGTNQMDIYDNGSAGSGIIIGIVPASAAVGTIVACKAPCANGIAVKGDMNNPGVTAFYTPVF